MIEFIRNGVGSKLEICHITLNILIENNLKLRRCFPWILPLLKNN